MRQSGFASLLSMFLIVFGVAVGVYFLQSSTGFLSNAWDMIGPSKSAIIKIPLASPSPKIASASATPVATSSAKPTASASAKVSALLK